MAQTKDKYGYSQTCLCFDGRQRTVTVHRLVALAFIGEPPRGKPQINHKNGRKDDNRPSNLEWCTVKHNIRHALAMGLKIPQNGSAIGNSKLMESQVLDIKSRTIKRGDQCRIAKEFGISEASVSLILSGGTWSHISP